MRLVGSEMLQDHRNREQWEKTTRCSPSKVSDRIVWQKQWQAPVPDLQSEYDQTARDMNHDFVSSVSHCSKYNRLACWTTCP